MLADMTFIVIPEEGNVGNGELVEAKDTMFTLGSDGFRVVFDYTMNEVDEKLGMPKNVRYSATLFYYKNRIDGLEVDYEDIFDRYCLTIAIGVHLYRQYFKKEIDALVLFNQIYNWMQDGK